MASSLLLYLLVILIGLILFIGLILICVGWLTNKNRLRIHGFKMAAIPIGLIVLLLLLQFLADIFFMKPSNHDLVGTYQIVKVTGLKLDYETNNDHQLIFFDNNTFQLTPTPHIKLCNRGKYDVDYQTDFNELSFYCHKRGYTTAHINRGFWNFQIEFIIGDPDSGKSIFFEKL